MIDTNDNVKDGYETDYIEDGIRLGTVLGRKLQVRGESRETKWTRLDSGRIDKRLISELVLVMTEFSLIVLLRNTQTLSFTSQLTLVVLWVVQSGLTQ